MNKEPKELTREKCTNTKRIRFWSKGEIAESDHAKVQNYKNLQDIDKARLIISERIVN